MGSSSILELDISLKNIWRSWFRFRHGKRATREITLFEYYLERELPQLYQELLSGAYRHGPYRHFVVTDNKRRGISVAGVRDRVVHRLLYDYLVKIYNHTFSYDAWSCRKSKGVIGAIERAEQYIRSHPRAVVWRMDITKFFDSVQQRTLSSLLTRRVKDQKALSLLEEVLASYHFLGQRERERERERVR